MVIELVIFLFLIQFIVAIFHRLELTYFITIQKLLCFEQKIKWICFWTEHSALDRLKILKSQELQVHE